MVRFHDAISVAIEFAGAHLSQYDKVYVIRDLVGRVSLALNVPDDQIEEKAELSQRLHERLGQFGPGPDVAVQSQDDLLLPEEIFETPEAICLRSEPITITLVDRLMNNQDWLRPPLVDQPPLPTAVAFSIKGGVGRSTAFASWAHHLAGVGYKVLAVDLDLEAPGLQSLLLQGTSERQQDRRPSYGIVDWLVEGRVGQADRALFEDMLGGVALPPDVPGEIQVIPALGAETKDYVAKLGRAYLPVVDLDGQERGFAEAVMELLQMAAERAEPFDVALLDARAGMHDIGAAAVTRLGAQAFLFARNDPQTWTAYAALFAHLRWSPAVQWGMPDRDLRWRLSTVGAMADGNRKDLEDLRGRSYETWLGLYDEEQEANPESPDEHDSEMPHWPIPIYRVDELRGASFHDPDRTAPKAVLERAFDEFFAIADRRLLPSSEDDAA